MTSQDTDQIPEPTEGKATDESDTEGHSLLNIELARTISADRARETTKLDRDMARARDAKSKDGGGFFKRLGRR